MAQGELPKAESDSLLRDLTEARAWDLPTYEDSHDGTANFEAELVVDGRRSQCKGLCQRHTPVLQALLDTPSLHTYLVRAFESGEKKAPEENVKSP